MSQTKEKKSIWDTPLLSTKVKNANVKAFPEGILGYFGGPFFALVPNGIINVFLMQYWKNVLGLDSWAGSFIWLLPLLSSILVVIGNLFVGKLMNGKPKKAGKARPLIVLSMPVIAIALFALFMAPYPFNETGVVNNDVTLWTLIVVAVGYNLFYAFAWPLYFTSHSAMVNLSTRNSNQRSLLGTMAMAAQVGAAGVAGMAGGFLTDLFRLLPSAENSKYWVNPKADAANKVVDEARLLADRASANQRWMIVMIILIVALVIGCLLEYFFTRERITEESFMLADREEEASKNEVKKASMAEQIKICVHDKYWWLIIIFFLLYQLGGMLKNNGQPFYSEAWTGAQSLNSTIGIAGAIPTAVGMVFVWPLAVKFSKGKTIGFGAFIAAALGLIGFIPLLIPSILNGNPSKITGVISGISIAAFCLKALGTVPAMYVSLALMSDVLDHQEAVHGKRTDGFTMAVYGSIMIAMTGIANAIIVGLDTLAAGNTVTSRILQTFAFFGGEVICYLVIGVMFLFMNVEKYGKADHKIILEAQKAECLAAGKEWIEPAVRAKQEEEEANAQAEAARIAELKSKCEKSGLSFEAEEAKYQAAKAEKEKVAAEKKAAAEAKKAEKEKAAAEKYAALPAEKREAIEAKKAAMKKKAEEDEIRFEAEVRAMREAALAK